MFQGIAGDEQTVPLTLYTDSYVIRGSIRTRQRRVTDILNGAEHNFLVLNDAVLDEYGSRDLVVRSEYAQVNLSAVLFAVADTAIDALPELRTPKVAEQAIVSIPPFRVTGRIHLLPERSLRDALEELLGRFVPVTEAAYWSDTIGEARQTAPMVAVNHARAHILAPYREVDPWAGLDRSADAGSRPVEQPGRTSDAVGQVPTDAASTSAPTGSQDPWRTGSGSGGSAPAHDPWRDTRSASDEPPPAPGNPWGGPGGDPWGARRSGSDEA